MKETKIEGESEAMRFENDDQIGFIQCVRVERKVSGNPEPEVEFCNFVSC